jgi:hypothetical protein
MAKDCLIFLSFRLSSKFGTTFWGCSSVVAVNWNVYQMLLWTVSSDIFQELHGTFPIFNCCGLELAIVGQRHLQHRVSYSVSYPMSHFNQSPSNSCLKTFGELQTIAKSKHGCEAHSQILIVLRLWPFLNHLGSYIMSVLLSNSLTILVQLLNLKTGWVQNTFVPRFW